MSLKRILFVTALLLSLINIAQATQDNQIAPPDVRTVDKHGVNLQTGQVTASQETVSIGGERGLSHSLSMHTNHFSAGTGGLYGYVDKYAGNAKYVSMGAFPNVTGFSCAQVTGAQVWVMRVFGPEGSQDFVIKVNGNLTCDLYPNGATSGYVYEALGDTRNSLERLSNPSALRWTRPDGTQLYYQGGSNAITGGRLYRIVYPDGFTINIEPGNVTTNTGFHLKYEYDTSTTQGLSSAKQALFNQYAASLPNGIYMQMPDSSPANFAGANPKRVRAVNRAVEYCTPSVSQTCESLTQWPAATFSWLEWNQGSLVPMGGLPRAMYLGQSVLRVQDAAGRTGEYHYEAQDVMKLEDGSYAGWMSDGSYHPYYPNQRWSPRLTGIKSTNSTGIDRSYQYKNVFNPQVVSSGDGGIHVEFFYWQFSTEVGQVINASTPLGSAGYTTINDLPGRLVIQGVLPEGPFRVENSTSPAGTIVQARVPDDGNYFFQSGYRNFVQEYYPNGHSPGPVKRYEYDGRGNLKKIIMRQGAPDETVIEAGYLTYCTSAARKDCNKPLWVKDALGNQTDYVYDSQTGQVLRVTGPADANNIRPVTRYEYAPFSAAYYRQNGTTIEQDAQAISLLWREKTCRTTETIGDTCAGGSLDEVVTEYDYGPQDGSPNNLWLRSVRVTAEANGVLQTRTTCYEYDQYGNRIGETKPAGASGGCASTTPQQPAPHKYAKRYNKAGQLLGEISPDPDGDGLNYPAVRYTYDSRGLLTKAEHGLLMFWQNETVMPASWSGFSVSKQVLTTYDSLGRKLSEKLTEIGGAAATLTQYAYDGGSRILCKAVRMNPALAPGDACTLGTEGVYGADRITRYEYNASGKVLKERRAVGRDLEQVYVRYTYTAEDQIETVTDANGNTAKFEYDGYGRKTKWCFPSDTAASETWNCDDYESYGYDANGNRTSLRKRDGKVIGYQYDNLNRMIYKNIPDTAANDVYYRYELSGAQLYARFGSHSGQGITTNYTGFGEPEQEQVTLNGVTRTINRLFDVNSNRTRITHPDNQYFTYQYDGLNRLQTIRENGSTALISDAYDAFERPQSRATTGNAMTLLEYDTVSWLDSIEYQFPGLADDLTIEFGYNPAGQLIQQTLSNGVYHHSGGIGSLGEYVVNGQNEYQSVNGATFTYDANGNLTSDGSRTYAYDVENRLISVSGGSPAVSATLSYDPMGRLNRYTVNGTTTDFLYDGDSLIAEYQSGSVTKRYVHGTAVDTPLVQYTGSPVGSGNRQFLHKNHQGSVIAASSNAGAIAYINTYDAYGVPAAANQGRFGYTGQMYLPELKLYHYRARVYNPHIGRFLQTDPIGYADQMNMYAYVGNDPMNATDPSGMAKCAKSMSEENCQTAQESADSARDTAQSLKGAFRDLAGKVKSGKLSDADKKQLDGLSKINKNFGTAKGLERLAKGMDKIANRIGERGEGVTLRNGSEKKINGSVPVAYVNHVNFGLFTYHSKTVYLNSSFFSGNKTSDWRSGIMLHEGAHTAGYMGDIYGVAGVNGLEGRDLWDNADTYACAAYPLDC